MTFYGTPAYWIGPNGTFIDMSITKRNTLVSSTSGILFSIGWWFFIDAVVYSHHNQLEMDQGGVNALYWVPGILSTLGLLMVMSIPSRLLSGNDVDGEFGSGSKFIALLCFFVLFCGLTGSIWVFIAGYLLPHNKLHHKMKDVVLTSLMESYKNKIPIDPPHPLPPTPRHFSIWPGICILLQNVFIFISTFLFRFGKIEDDLLMI